MSNMNNRDNYDRSNYNYNDGNKTGEGNTFTRKRNRKDSDEGSFEKSFKSEKKKSPDEEDYENHKYNQNKKEKQKEREEDLEKEKEKEKEKEYYYKDDFYKRNKYKNRDRDRDRDKEYNTRDYNNKDSSYSSREYKQKDYRDRDGRDNYNSNKYNNNQHRDIKSYSQESKDHKRNTKFSFYSKNSPYNQNEVIRDLSQCSSSQTNTQSSVHRGSHVNTKTTHGSIKTSPTQITNSNINENLEQNKGVSGSNTRNYLMTPNIGNDGKDGNNGNIPSSSIPISKLTEMDITIDFNSTLNKNTSTNNLNYFCENQISKNLISANTLNKVPDSHQMTELKNLEHDKMIVDKNILDTNNTNYLETIQIQNQNQNHTSNTLQSHTQLPDISNQILNKINEVKTMHHTIPISKILNVKIQSVSVSTSSSISKVPKFSNTQNQTNKMEADNENTSNINVPNQLKYNTGNIPFNNASPHIHKQNYENVFLPPSKQIQEDNFKVPLNSLIVHLMNKGPEQRKLIYKLIKDPFNLNEQIMIKEKSNFSSLINSSNNKEDTMDNKFLDPSNNPLVIIEEGKVLLGVNHRDDVKKILKNEKYHLRKKIENNNIKHLIERINKLNFNNELQAINSHELRASLNEIFSEF